MAAPARADLLATIVAATERAVASRRARCPDADLEQAAAPRTPRAEAFERALIKMDQLNVIAECKRRSPSRGVLRPDYDAAALAREYEAAGAAAISVLTEPTFFDGGLEHLAAVRRAVQLPLLRKDFIVDRYQLLEARLHGADAVLLIVAALGQSALTRLLAEAGALGLATLVEVHGDEELDRAIQSGARIIGVNNRNLRTLEVDADTCQRLVSRVPPGVVSVAESGLQTNADLLRLARLGYRAFLIGERLVTSAAPGQVLAGLLGREPSGLPASVST